MSYTINDVILDLCASETIEKSSPIGMMVGVILGLLFWTCVAITIWLLLLYAK